MEFHKYSIKGQYLGVFTKEELFSQGYSGKDVSKIKKATKGTKGYGYYERLVIAGKTEKELLYEKEGFYWAERGVEILDTPTKRRKHVNDWVSANYVDIYESVSKAKEFNEDAFQEAMCALLEEAASDRSVNDYWVYLMFHNRVKKIDAHRTAQVKRKYEINDFSVTEEGSDEHYSFIEQYGTEYTDVNDEGDCIKHSNEDLKLDLLVHALHAYFPKEEIDAWIRYNTNTKGQRKVYTSIIDKYGWTTSKCRKVVRAVEAKAKEIALDVEGTYDIMKSVSLDDYSLIDLIN